MSEMMSEAEMPTYSSDTRGQLKESATKAKKHLPTDDDVADLAIPSTSSEFFYWHNLLWEESIELVAWFWFEEYSHHLVEENQTANCCFPSIELNALQKGR